MNNPQMNFWGFLSTAPLWFIILFISIMILLVLLLIILIASGRVEQIWSIKFTPRTTKSKREADISKSNYDIFKPSDSFDFSDINWHVRNGEWQLYEKKLIGQSSGLVLIENDDLGKEDFFMEILFSVNSEVDEINIQICGSELALRGNKYGLVQPEGQIENIFEKGGVYKDMLQAIGIRKSSNDLRIYLDGYFLYYLLPSSDKVVRNNIGIRTYKGQLTIFKIRFQNRSACKGFTNEYDESVLDYTLEEVNKIALASKLKVVTNDLFSYGIIANTKPINALNGLFTQFNNIVYNLVTLFEIRVPTDTPTFKQWIALCDNSVITEHQFNLGKEIDISIKRTTYDSDSKAQQAVQDTISLMRNLIDEYRKIVITKISNGSFKR